MSSRDIEASRSVESSTRKTCDNCGRTEVVSQPAPDAFIGWRSVAEGMLCPRCLRGGSLHAFSSCDVRSRRDAS